ncbi:MAG: dienelactone hydrolase family protein [Planctomycetota bacterium]|jgi:dienelactone hydrolase
MLQIPGRRSFLKMLGTGFASIGLQKLHGQSKPEIPTYEKEIPSKSFVDFLKEYGDEHKPSMTYHDGRVFRTWQRAFRRKIKSLRGNIPERVKPEIEILQTTELSDHIRLLIHFPVTQVSELIAYLLVPKNIKKGQKRAGIIALHGHHSHGIETICGVRKTDYPPYALQAVRSGYIVLAPAWWGWPGRDGHLDRIGDRDKCNVIQMAASMYGINVLDLHIQDGRAAIDVLCSHTDVDSKKIGCIGNSYGGRTSMWLTIFDDRVKACVPSGCMNIFRERSLKLSSCAIQYLPGLLQYGDVPELFSLIVPRPIQLQAGESDNLITVSDRDQIRKVVEKAYRLLGAEKNFEYVLHSRGHVFAWDLAVPFFKRHLKIDR